MLVLLPWSTRQTLEWAQAFRWAISYFRPVSSGTSGNLLKNTNTYRRREEKMASLSSLPIFFCCGFKKNQTVELGYFGLSQASLQKFAQNYSLVWDTAETVCHLSLRHSFTVAVLRSALSANSQQQCRAFPPLVNHSQKCHPSPENVFLHCSMTWHVPKVSVLYKYLWREK